MEKLRVTHWHLCTIACEDGPQTICVSLGGETCALAAAAQHPPETPAQLVELSKQPYVRVQEGDRTWDVVCMRPHRRKNYPEAIGNHDRGQITLELTPGVEHTKDMI